MQILYSERLALEAEAEDSDGIGVRDEERCSPGVSAQEHPREKEESVEDVLHSFVAGFLEGLVEAEPGFKNRVGASLVARTHLDKRPRPAQADIGMVRSDGTCSLARAQERTCIDGRKRAATQEARGKLRLLTPFAAESEAGQAPVYDVLGIVDLGVTQDQQFSRDRR